MFVRSLSILTLSLLLCLVSGFWAPVSAAKQPNIVVYFSDDHSQADCSLYGAADIPTPHMEKLAADGMMFTHAFVASPSCAPSRAAMLTGLMPARNGAEDNHSFPRPEVPCLISKLKKQGYKIISVGKTSHRRTKAYSWDFDETYPGRTEDSIRTDVANILKSHDKNVPLCLLAGTSSPHVPWPEKSSFNPDQVAIPPIHLDRPSTRKDRVRYYEELRQLDLLLGDLRTLIAKHLSEDTLFIHTSDHGAQWPFGKWTLYDYGTRVPFIASWPGHIKPGSKSDAFIQWTDLLPTLIDIAGGKAPENIDGKSFLPVLLGKSTKHRDEIYTTASGDKDKCIYPIRALRTRDWKLIHNLRPDLAFTNHITLLRRELSGIYWHDWTEAMKTDPTVEKVVMRYYKRPEFELYNMNDDPWELHNLAADPAQAERLATMNQKLEAWMKSQGDQRALFSTPRPLNDLTTWHPHHVDIPVVPKRK